MRLEQLCRALGEPALITPQAHRGLQTLYASYVQGGGLQRPPSAEDMAGWKRLAMEDDGEECDGETVAEVVQGPIRQVRIQGVLMRNPGFMQQWCMGAYSLARGQAEVDALAADPTCSCIILRIDSPGGSVAGTQEMAAAIRRAASVKTVIAIIEGQGCSGAYWLASQATIIIAAPTAIIGSIGAYIAYLDDAGWLAENGYSWQVFRAGEHKAAGMGRALTKAEKGFYQALVDQAYTAFAEEVLEARSGIESSTMQGQVFTASDAMDLGLIDAVEDNIPAFISALAVNPNFLAESLGVSPN